MVQSVARAPLTFSDNNIEDEATVQAKLFGIFPVKNVTVGVVQRETLIPCGLPFGVKLYTDGVMVVGMSDVETERGSANPSRNAGIQIGDIITKINGETVTTNEQVKAAYEKGGKQAEVVFIRNGNTLTTKIDLAFSKYDNEYKAGTWVRDSTAGLGTITFINPSDNTFGGLGHGICDVDTGSVMPMLKGSMVGANIFGVKKGVRGEPGELQGSFTESLQYGKLIGNTEFGVFGKADAPFSVGQALPVASAYEIKEGPAKILSTISGDTPKEYDIKITRIMRGSGRSNKNMTIEVTDKALLEQTSGIVQGMSGSPIIQDGKIIGAVTHVLVNDPTKGYGIFIENMLAAMDKL